MNGEQELLEQLDVDLDPVCCDPNCTATCKWYAVSECCGRWHSLCWFHFVMLRRFGFERSSCPDCGAGSNIWAYKFYSVAMSEPMT